MGKLSDALASTSACFRFALDATCKCPSKCTCSTSLGRVRLCLACTRLMMVECLFYKSNMLAVSKAVVLQEEPRTLQTQPSRLVSPRLLATGTRQYPNRGKNGTLSVISSNHASLESVRNTQTSNSLSKHKARRRFNPGVSERLKMHTHTHAQALTQAHKHCRIPETRDAWLTGTVQVRAWKPVVRSLLRGWCNQWCCS